MKMTEQTIVPTLHLIAQSHWHQPAFIVGNQDGLLALRAAIDRTLDGQEAQAELYADDGEGYSIHVRCVTDVEMEDIPMGYIEEWARDSRDWPDWMLRAR